MATNKDNEDMKKLIKAWEASKKFKALQVELDKLRKQYADFTTLSTEDINNYLSKCEVSKEQLELIIENDKALATMDAEVNFIEQLHGYRNLTKDQFLVKLQRSLVIFYISLLGYQRVENYEMCSLIQKVIDIQVRLQTRIMQELFICEDEDFEYIRMVQERIIQVILLDKQ